MKILRSLFVASFLAAMTVGAGCGSDQPDVVDDGKTISSVEVTPGIDTLAKGDSVKFTATVKYADGTSKDVTRDSETTWNTSSPEVATVDNEGNVTAVDEGAVDIRATYMGVEGEETFAVTP